MDEPLKTLGVEQQLETIDKLVEKLVEFGVTYGFQILGSLVFLFIGWKIGNWVAKKVTGICEAKGLDVTLSKFIGSASRMVILVFLIIITLGNFGITIAPLIALAGAGAFGATVAIQGPLSNYGAGIAIILARPFVVGNTIQVRGTYGVVDQVSLANTVLTGEDGERITVPNKEIVGQVIVNSDERRIVEPKICIAAGEDADKAVGAVLSALTSMPELKDGPAPQVGVHDFTYGGVLIGLRVWVPSMDYFQSRYRVNSTALKALRDAGIKLMTPGSVSVALPNPEADESAELPKLI